jgi:membrane-bound ClpP family serine protease
MSNELISLLVLVLIFVIATTLPINMGVLGLVATFVVGTAMGVSEDDMFLGFPGDLFIILVGVTYLFAIATNNGTVNWLIHAAVGHEHGPHRPADRLDGVRGARPALTG